MPQSWTGQHAVRLGHESVQKVQESPDHEFAILPPGHQVQVAFYPVSHQATDTVQQIVGVSLDSDDLAVKAVHFKMTVRGIASQALTCVGKSAVGSAGAD